MRKRGTTKNSSSIEMTTVGEKGRSVTSKGRDTIDGPLALSGQIISSQPRNTVTTVSSQSGFRLAQHMTIAGSFLDFALFVADVEHLKFILDAGKEKIDYYTMLIVCLIASLSLQVIISKG